jgi:hypothetical protein
VVAVVAVATVETDQVAVAETAMETMVVVVDALAAETETDAQVAGVTAVMVVVAQIETKTSLKY